MSSSHYVFANAFAVSQVPPAPESHVRRRSHEGHDSHFLSRLDRLNAAHVELALSLYRDARLVRALLQAAKLPEEAERAAISLHDPKDGPFIIVTRDGGFITCLATGMSVGPHPVIARGLLDRTISKEREQRRRTDVANAIMRRRHQTRADPIRRIDTCCDTLSREEFLAIATIQSRKPIEFWCIFLERAARAIDLQTRLTMKSMRPSHRDVTMLHFQTAHAAGHALLLATMDNVDKLRETYRNASPTGPALTAGLAWLGDSGLVLRGAWAAARCGKLFLPQYKHQFAKATQPSEILAAAVGLSAIGCRHSQTVAEIQKTFASNATDDLRRFAASFACETLEDSDRLAAAALDLGRSMYIDLTADLATESPNRYACAEDVPDALARTALLTLQGDAFSNPLVIKMILAMAPALREARAEDFFWPEAVLADIGQRLTPDRADLAFDRQRAYFSKPPPVRRTVTVGRNEPCPCDSGKKYKRCCG